MLKRLLIPAALVFALSGCVTASGPSPSNVKQIQDMAVTMCRFLPAVQTITNILISSSNAMAASALSVAAAICGSVTTNPLADGPGAKNYRPRVNGVRIRGRFV